MLLVLLMVVKLQISYEDNDFRGKNIKKQQGKGGNNNKIMHLVPSLTLPKKYNITSLGISCCLFSENNHNKNTINFIKHRRSFFSQQSSVINMIYLFSSPRQLELFSHFICIPVVGWWLNIFPPPMLISRRWRLKNKFLLLKNFPLNCARKN